MDNEIRICFSLFVNHMKGNIKNLPEYDYNSMTIQQIRGEMDVIFMKYILNSSFSISDSSVGMVAYKHLKKMIDNDEMKIKYNKMESEMKLLGLENTILKQELTELRNKVSSTLFPMNTLSLNTASLQQPKGWFS
ncbi:hypothetical protein QKU48_gp0916 [Fadolivirus algeromassiliense]|jgi:hypothetical protein|uniref:Uncharacterized protein n=1 Tax=Fadolivirus FV1/VV64 TaxID=3070911 RepID=A0A7D3UVV9_9VIRU|nr:hypothetical protein QKU48_gp0916 [Fadolivirus algeromassiliense]QKF94374.1 hypothetical protein Fadolivirus_1_916 [Fadolivirus FV1/VV64]